MSFWVYLEDEKGNSVEVKPFSEGGTYSPGSTEAELNITYNYSGDFYKALDNQNGLRGLHGKTAKDVLQQLISAIDALGTNTDNSYWASTPGNAGHALSILANWAKQHPEAIFRVS